LRARSQAADIPAMPVPTTAKSDPLSMNDNLISRFSHVPAIRRRGSSGSNVAADQIKAL
jgi:hypothetical protein